MIACDEQGNDHHALLTAVWGEDKTHPKEYGPTVNLLYVTEDETKTDQYGRQIDRHLSSTVHARAPGAVHGRYWRWPEEGRNHRGGFGI